MRIAFTTDDFKEFIEEIDNSISISLTTEQIENLTMAIARKKGSDLKEHHVKNAIEQYKRDHMRCILWRAVMNGMLNLEISDDGSELAFVPDELE